MSSITIRVRSADGTQRVDVPSTATVAALKSIIQSKTQVQEFSLSRDAQGADPLTDLTKSLAALNIDHGAMLYLHKGSAPPKPATDQACAAAETVMAEDDTKTKPPLPPMDEVDVELAKDPGLVKRKTDKQMCHHGDKAMCEHCMPLEAYDRRILEERNLKAISFHAHLRSLRSTAARARFAHLATHSFKVKKCSKHPPWPQAICSDCQPKSMTLDRQKFRHVDHVEFGSAAIMNAFLDAWRGSGIQRYGWMYGTYQRYEYVPLGIKAVVEFIYEPMQQCTGNSIDMIVDPGTDRADHIARMLGLQRIGWIFTDLEPLKSSPAQCVNSRNDKTYFLRSNECVLAAHLQNMYPNRCEESETGVYGSKFVTVVVSGDADNNIVPLAYQVSQQAMDLEKDGVFEYSKDPSVGRIAQSNKHRFLPEVFYKTKSEFGIDVSRRADPTFALDYLIVSLSVAFSSDDTHPLHTDKFPIENRDDLPTHAAVASYIESTRSRSDLYCLSNAHFLLHLATCPPYNIETGIPEMCEAVKERSETKATEALRSPLFDEFLATALMGSETEASTAAAAAAPERKGSSSASGSRPGGNQPSSSSSVANDAPWQCGMCTYINMPASAKCEMCMGAKPQ